MERGKCMLVRYMKWRGKLAGERRVRELQVGYDFKSGVQ